ncbi:Ig-like domain-containing protein [Flavobacterium sp.]|uniref:Ig-like domain-containing protein n=1 Tax=Flavobacterium sp. TaxID=239 RepID=UPI0025BD2094|nr:Ig-like domain-containing protein [Flavobacterium sp.]MBA4155193.1 glycosyl hydrolase family 16 [Flavobacterium sp.]
MKSNFNNRVLKHLSLWMIVLAFFGCENDLSDFEEASYSKDPNVFIDTFSPGLNYAAFSNTVISAFQVDNEVTYNNSSASMRFDVPNVNDPEGAYAGGAFFTTVGRDLSGYDALTFWAKSSKAATLDVVGFGIDLGENKYPASISGARLSTTWKKYIIPIPDASKLKTEKGMFYFSEGPENGDGYTFWIDEVKFEKLGTIAHGEAAIMNGANVSETTFVGVNSKVDGVIATFNLPNGVNQAVNLSTSYLEFTSSNASVASVDSTGLVTSLSPGTATITAKFGDTDATGSLTVNCQGTFVHAPTPTRNSEDVISIFSDAYTNVPVNYYNGYWQPWQTTVSNDFTVNGDNILNYTIFNFVGIEFSSPTVNATMMSHIHLDVFIPGPIAPGRELRVIVVDFGADGTYSGGDDTRHSTTFTAPTLVSQNWVSIDIPFANMPNLASKSHLAQIILEGGDTSVMYVDNIYFYNDGSVIPSVPTTAAPTPTTPAANVTSVFSDAYTNIAGTNLNPSWGQATVVTQVPIAGNNTLKYAGLNYQGIELGTPQDVSSKNFLHLDYYSANSTSLKVYLISPGPVEKSFTLTVPSPGGWNSVDIPLSTFSPVNLSNVIQLKFDGNGDIYLDNIYFRN